MENELVSMAQQFSGLPMDSLIGGPLMAAANANASMAVTQTRFLLDTAFKQNADSTGKVSSYEPIMIQMKLIRGVITPAPAAKPGDKAGQPSITQVSTTFNLPILTILPLNSLAVDSVDIGFEMEVKSSFSEETSESSKNEVKAEASWEAKADFGMFSVSIRGSASYDHQDSQTHNTHYEKSNSAKYTVKVHAGQLPLPKGVNTIIEAFAQSIQPITLPTEGAAESNK